jgi:hypothetical protein
MFGGEWPSLNVIKLFQWKSTGWDRPHGTIHALRQSARRNSFCQAVFCAASSVSMLQTTITELDHRSIELTDHTHRCWARSPARPVVCNGYEREFVYVYGAVSPVEGQLDTMITRQMNTVNMSAFLAQVSAKHRRELEQPSRLPILGGGSPPSVNCPVLDGKHIRCRGR